jgi:hypothetical protein
MVFRASWSGPSQLLPADAVASPPSLQYRCREGAGLGRARMVLPLDHTLTAGVMQSGGASPSELASMFTPSLARRSLLRVCPRAGGIRAWARGCSAVGLRSCRSPFPSRGCSYTGINYRAGSGAGCRLRGLGSPQLPVKVGQLLVELAPSFCELVETRPSLGVGGVVTWRWLRVGAARSRRHANEALA